MSKHISKHSLAQAFDGLLKTNGIDSTLVKAWEKGDTFVVQTKGSWEEPKEIVIAKKEHVSTEAAETEKQTTIAKIFIHTFRIIGECGTVVVIELSLTSPICYEYEIFKNWKVYFNIKDEKAKNIKQKLKYMKEYIDNYTAFEKKFKDENPEKLI